MQPETVRKPHKFLRPSDHFRLAATAALAWAPTLYMLTPQVGMKAAIGLTAAFSAVSAGLCLSPIRTLISNIRNWHFQTKNGCLPPLPALTDIINDISHSAGYEQPLKTHIIPGATLNATTAGKEIYFTSHALFALDEDEQKFLVAHEISHDKTNDEAAESVLTLPRIYSWGMMGYGVFVFMDMISGGPRGSDAPALYESMKIATICTANFLWQTSLWLYLFRAHEYRADRNAATLSDQSEAGVSMLGKMSQNQAWDDDIFSSLIAHHPHPDDRIVRLKKEAAGINLPPP